MLDLGSFLSIGKNKLTGNIAFLCDLDIFKYDVGKFNPTCGVIQKNVIASFYDKLGQRFERYDPECEWEGIKCNSNDAIVGIELGKFIMSHCVSNRLLFCHCLLLVDNYSFICFV